MSWQRAMRAGSRRRAGDGYYGRFDSDAAWPAVEHEIDLVIDSGPCHGQVTTVIDLSGDAPRLVRAGSGDIRPFGFVKEALH